MTTLRKLGAGLLVTAFLLGAVSPAPGEDRREQRQQETPLNRDLAPSLVNFISPWLGARLHQPNVCPLDFMFSQPGSQPQGRRDRNLALPPAESLFPWLSAEPRPAFGVLGAARAATLAAEQSKGTIQAMPLDKNELILKDSKGTKMTFFLSKNCKVFINDKEAKLSDLRTGDEASVTYEQQGFVPMVAVEIRCARR